MKFGTEVLNYYRISQLSSIILPYLVSNMSSAGLYVSSKGVEKGASGKGISTKVDTFNDTQARFLA
jgi:hypothetical protein